MSTENIKPAADDVEGHRLVAALPTEADGSQGDDDVEGHRVVAALPTEADGSQDDDVAGHGRSV